MTKPHKYTKEQHEWLKLNVSGNDWNTITDRFNKLFDLDFHKSRLQTYCNRHKIYTGSTGRFEKGNKPWNTGTKGATGANSGSFKKGNIPKNYKPIGSERINKYGYLQVKVTTNKWELKHRYIYEQHHGIKIPKGHVVIFLDRDIRNFNIENLKLISRREHAVMNRKIKYRENPELNDIATNVVRLMIKTNERIRDA